MTPEMTFLEHAYETHEINDWIERNMGDIDAVKAFGPIAMMKGRFIPYGNSYIYDYEFMPHPMGAQRAIVMPVREDGAVVDIVAWRFSHAALDVWGCVTHAGRFLNRDAIYKPRSQPLFVCDNWHQWIARDCDAVMPLRVSAIPELRQAGHVSVGSTGQALRLLYEAFLFPASSHPQDPAWQEARKLGRERIWIEDEVAA